jgi:SAM-dependent methyltransferase
VTDRDVERLLAEQIRYYEDRAPIYEDLWFRRGPYDMGAEWNATWFRETTVVEAAVDELDATGSVLELACGSGLWTRRLAPRARRYVGVDAAPAMLALNAERAVDLSVELIHADVFTWEPSDGELFDLIFFGFFLSHVPPDRFERWWERLRSWLASNGAVCFVDDVAAPDRPRSSDRIEGGPEFAHRRRLPGGRREYTIVKVFYEPHQLASRLLWMGWEAEVQSTGEHLLYGSARPR